jgi:hypothetical protein
MTPGTTSLISVPKLEEFPSVSFAPDASCALPHALQSEVSVLPPVRSNGVNTFAIVTYTQSKVVSIIKLYFQLTSPRMHLRA